MTHQDSSRAADAARDMNTTASNESATDAQIESTITRILAADSARAERRSEADSAAPARSNHAEGGRAQAISELEREHSSYDGDQEDLAERRALRRVAGLSTELEDVSEVEYRQLRLEKVVLTGLWAAGTAQDGENSLAELAALAETAGSEVLDSLLQRRVKPDPATFLGSGKAAELKDIV